MLAEHFCLRQLEANKQVWRAYPLNAGEAVSIEFARWEQSLPAGELLPTSSSGGGGHDRLDRSSSGIIIAVMDCKAVTAREGAWLAECATTKALALHAVLLGGAAVRREYVLPSAIAASAALRPRGPMTVG